MQPIREVAELASSDAHWPLDVSRTERPPCDGHCAALHQGATLSPGDSCGHDQFVNSWAVY